MTIKKKAGGGFVYEPMSQDDMFKLRAELKDDFRTFVDSLDGFDEISVELDEYALCEVLTRTDKRKDYFKVFHETELVNGIKEAAFRAYWILKFRPFTIHKPATTELPADASDTIHINEAFAIYLLFSAIQRECDKAGRSFSFTDEIIELPKYGFQYWDLSKEAIILIAEALNESSKN